MRNKISLAIILLTLGGCNLIGGPKKLPDVTVHKDVPVINVNPTPMAFKPLNFQVYDLAGLKAMVARMEARGDRNAVVYVLDDNNYQALAMNLSEMKRYIEDQKNINTYLSAAIAINAKPATTEKTTVPK